MSNFGYTGSTPPKVNSTTSSFTNDVTFDQRVFALGTVQASGEVITAAATTGRPSLNIPPGVSPLAPISGDLWNVGGVLHFRTTGSGVSLVDDNSTQTINGYKTFGFVNLGGGPFDDVGFYGATPIAQPNTTGTTTGYTANTSANNVFNESTFTGNVGSKAYTISDIVRALKQLGIIAS